MALTQVLVLVGAGLAGGFLGGLIGVGGGVIFTPVLFFYFQGLGVAPEALAPLTIGSSLFCTLVVAVASAWFQFRRNAVRLRVALGAGLSSAAAVYLTTRFVTTQPWYDARVFQVVFSLILLVVVVRMVWPRRGASAERAERRAAWPVLFGVGTAAGAVASAAGVGGGVVLVPAYHGFLRLPVAAAVGTSSATIAIIALAGVVSYAVTGRGAPVPETALGYVDVGRAALLSAPALLSARFGVRLAHRIDTRALRLTFAAVACFVAARLILRALGG